MTAEARTAGIAAHEANLKRYAWLLTTQLTDLERAFVHKRIAEERLALERLSRPPADMTAALPPLGARPARDLAFVPWNRGREVAVSSRSQVRAGGGDEAH